MPTLAELLPAKGSAPLTGDEILDRFVSWVSSNGLSLYPAQEEALLSLLDGKHVVLSTPTGSGKSLVATFLHYLCMATGKRSVYTCPIKALVNEKFFALVDAFGAENVGMATGDATVNREAPIVCCTAEILENLCYAEDPPSVDAVVMDEFHYYADRARGSAWQVPLLTMERTTFLLMSATLGDTTTIEDGIRDLTRREVARVESGDRPVPLTFEYRETPLHETIEELVAGGRAPVYLVNFTQRAAAEQAQNLMSVNFSSKEEKQKIAAALESVKFDSPYGKDVSRYLRHGIGLHHAGLLPKYRLTVEKLAQQGLLKIVSGTDTLGMGINIPLKTVLFTQLCKYDGEKTAILSARDFHQIAGRAGRKGFDDRGWVVAQAPEHVIENKRQIAKEAAGGKKQVRKQPPPKGFVPWDAAIFEKLQQKKPETLESRFEPEFGMILQLLQAKSTRRGGGYARLVEMIARSHQTPKQKSEDRRMAASRFRTLRGAGLVEVHRVPGGGGSYLRSSGSLQHDFSLLHTLSLYLLDTLPRIPKEHETYALDVLSLCEAILEDPDVVLYKQLDKLKTAKMLEMKAQRVEYDERIAELEKMEWPKPNRDFVYATFNEFAAKHPWVGAENIRPKSVARDLLEKWLDFDGYVKEYGLERSEGVLLRYLSQAYKTLVQSVPEGYRTDELDLVAADLRAVIRAVDSSLLDEWERRRDARESGAAAPVLATGATGVPAHSAAPAPPKPLDADPRAFAARVRSDLYRLLRAIAREDWSAALALLAPGEAPWTAERLAAETAALRARGIDVTPRARRPELLLLKRAGDHRWDASQRVIPPLAALDPQGTLAARAAALAAGAGEAGAESDAGDADGDGEAFALELRIDARPRASGEEEAPLLELLSVGSPNGPSRV